MNEQNHRNEQKCNQGNCNFGIRFDQILGNYASTTDGEKRNQSEFQPDRDSRQRKEQQLKTDNENVMGEIQVIRICCQDIAKRSLSIPISNSQRGREPQGCDGKKVQAKPHKQPEQLFHFTGSGTHHQKVRGIISNKHENESDKPGFVMTWKLAPFNPFPFKGQDSQDKISDVQEYSGYSKLNNISQCEPRFGI
jgi:hypothetical protein